MNLTFSVWYGDYLEMTFTTQTHGVAVAGRDNGRVQISMAMDELSRMVKADSRCLIEYHSEKLKAGIIRNIVINGNTIQITCDILQTLEKSSLEVK